MKTRESESQRGNMSSKKSGIAQLIATGAEAQLNNHVMAEAAKIKAGQSGEKGTESGKDRRRSGRDRRRSGRDHKKQKRGGRDRKRSRSASSSSRGRKEKRSKKTRKHSSHKSKETGAKNHDKKSKRRKRSSSSSSCYSSYSSAGSQSSCDDETALGIFCAGKDLLFKGKQRIEQLSAKQLAYLCVKLNKSLTVVNIVGLGGELEELRGQALEKAKTMEPQIRLRLTTKHAAAESSWRQR